MQGVVGFFYNPLYCKFSKVSSSEKKFKIGYAWQNYATSLWPHFFAHHVYAYLAVDTMQASDNESRRCL